jgi:hypothetical protein
MQSKWLLTHGNWSNEDEASVKQGEKRKEKNITPEP